uniref:Olfactory receptor n=1 Tax=Pogona vitticeps TaxID=103695 RepID=A0ABM5GSC8_9SAUR
MKEDNETFLPEEFILTGLTDHAVLKLILFVIFLFIYLAAVFGNLLSFALIKTDPCLHTPMYFFLSNLSILEVCSASTVVPQMLSHLLAEKRVMPQICCALQLFFFLTFAIAEIFLLTVMSYDRYVAICFPLHYLHLVTKQVCILMAAACWMGALLFSVINTAFTLKLSFGGHNKIDHFLCEMPAMVRSACGGIYYAQMCMFISCVFTLILPISLILVSYACILYTVLGNHCSISKRKAISTCSSHLTVVILFFGSAISVYLGPHSSSSKEHLKMASVFYIVITPALNPIIYSLRNKEVMQAFKRVRYKVTEIN